MFRSEKMLSKNVKTVCLELLPTLAVARKQNGPRLVNSTYIPYTLFAFPFRF